MTKKPSPGDTVRLTGDFLRNTGQYTGSAPRDKWIVQACDCGLCRRGNFIATNERNLDDDGQRHINIANVELVKAPRQHSTIKAPPSYPTQTPEQRAFDDRPHAAAGWTSYRLRGPYGYIHIGARNHDEAMSEAARSTREPKRSALEIWNGTRFVKAKPALDPKRSERSTRAAITRRANRERADWDVSDGSGRAPKVIMTRHHSTMKTPPAQLNREIAEALASPPPRSYEEDMAALEKKHAGVKRGGSLRAGHVPVVPKMSTAKRVPKTKVIFVVQGNYGYGHGWEDLTAADTRKEAQQNLREYRANESAPFRLIKRRERIAV